MTEEVNSVQANASIGAVKMSLQQARDAKGLTVQDAAGRLRMSPKQIEHLEAKEWSKLPGAAFVRGALRSYGKLLDCDVTDLLQEVGGYGQAADVLPSTSLATRMPRQGAYGFDSTGRNSWLAWLLLALAAVIGFGFFYGGDKLEQWMKPVASPVTSSAPTQSPAVVVAQKLPPQVEPVTASGTLPSPIPAAPPAEAAPLTPVPSTTLPSAIPAASAPAAQAPTPVPALAAIELLSTANAWVVVRDAEKKVLFVGNLKPNVAQSISDGKAPFQLVIGSARTVTLKWRGKAVDLVSKTRDDVARFSLE